MSCYFDSLGLMITQLPTRGTGSNYRGVANAIAATGYDLYVGHEFMPKGDAIVALKQAYAVLDV